MSHGVAARPASGSGAELPGRRVLIVDDNQDGCTAMALLLELHGFHAACAHDGTTALALLDRGEPAPDVVLVDLRLPDLDGRELSKELRTRLPDATIALVTGMDTGDVDLAACGLDLVILKPLELEKLLRQLSAPRPSVKPPPDRLGSD